MRTELADILRNLDKAATEGDAQLAAALAVKASDPGVDRIVDRIRELQKSQGNQAAMREVRNMLAVAATR